MAFCGGTAYRSINNCGLLTAASVVQVAYIQKVRRGRERFQREKNGFLNSRINAQTIATRQLLHQLQQRRQ